MPQRHRPRLKRYTIVCSWCNTSAIKLYPSRESVRQKLSPYRFCSSVCQRDHWESRRKAEWSASPYPCAQCGTAITPQQAAGRRRSYCTATCKQAAARARIRRNPAGAVMAARERFVTAWQRALTAVNAWVVLDAHDAPVGAAYNQATNVLQDASSTDEEKTESIKRIRYAISGLDGPQYGDEPDRSRAARGEWTAWWTWWKDGRSRRWTAYEDRLGVATAATADLHKHERVAARRAETARLRRAAA